MGLRIVKCKGCKTTATFEDTSNSYCKPIKVDYDKIIKFINRDKDLQKPSIEEFEDIKECYWVDIDKHWMWDNYGGF